MTLYEIDQGLRDIMESVDPETGEWTGDPEAWEELNLARDAKLENTACYIKDLRGQILTFRSEIKTLQQRLKSLESKEKWLMENLRRSLDGQNFETARCSLRYKKNPETVKIENREEVISWAEINAPDAIKHMEPELSKNDLKVLLKSGVDVPGCYLAQDMRLEVK